MTQAPELDQGTADRLLDGSVGPHEAPLGWERVAALLRVAGAGGAPVDPPAELLTAMRARPLARRRRAAIAGAFAGALVFAGTGAAAANGSLPDAVQGFVHDVASIAGIDVPAGSERSRPEHAPGDDSSPGRSDEAPGRPTGDEHHGAGGRSDDAPGRPTELPAAADDERQPAGTRRPAELPADERPEVTPAIPATPATPAMPTQPATPPIPPAQPPTPLTPVPPSAATPEKPPTPRVGETPAATEAEPAAPTVADGRRSAAVPALAEEHPNRAP